MYNFFLRKGVIKIFKLLLPIYAYDFVYNFTYNFCLCLLLWSPPLANILVFLSLPLFLFLFLPFPLALLLLPCIFKSLCFSLLYTLYFTTFLEFRTLPGDLVFGKLLRRLYLLKGLNNNIKSGEKIENKVLISLKGD